MRISDSERREVAARLRGVTEKELCYVFLGEILNFAVGGRCLDDEGDIDERLILNRLADLIDRPTCRNVSGYQDTFKCSECGYKIGLIAEVCNEHSELLHMPLMPLRCPNCKAEVVE